MNGKQFATILLIAVTLFAGACDSPAPGRDNPKEKEEVRSHQPTFRKDGTLAFYDRTSKDTLISIDIEIVETPNAIGQGLMYRRQMADTVGMLFLFERSKPQSFWMKNTYISLDMIFVDELQQIVTIRDHTTVLSTASVVSSKDAQYVIEVIAGFCEKNNVKEGDYVTFARDSGS